MGFRAYSGEEQLKHLSAPPENLLLPRQHRPTPMHLPKETQSKPEPSLPAGRGGSLCPQRAGGKGWQGLPVPHRGCAGHAGLAQSLHGGPRAVLHCVVCPFRLPKEWRISSK